MSPERAIQLLRQRDVFMCQADADRIADCVADLCRQINQLRQTQLLPPERSPEKENHV